MKLLLTHCADAKHTSNHTTPFVAGVGEKRSKKIKAWALASPVAVSVARPVDCSAPLPHCCALCGKTKSELAAGEKLRSCSGCGAARYCSGECQKTAWPGHKKECSGGLIRLKSEEKLMSIL